MKKCVKTRFSVFMFLFVIFSLSWASAEEILVGIENKFVMSFGDDVGKGNDREEGVPLEIEFFRSSSHPHSGLMIYTKPPRSWIGLQFTRPQNEKIRLENTAEFVVVFSKPLQEKWTFMVQDYTRTDPDPMFFDLKPIPEKREYRIRYTSLRNKGGRYPEFNQILVSPSWESSKGECELARITILPKGGDPGDYKQNKTPPRTVRVGNRGFTFTGYWNGVYEHNKEEIRRALEVYRGENLHVNILVTFYVDEEGMVRVDKARTPCLKEVNGLLEMLNREFPDFTTGIYWYLDPEDGSWRAEIENLVFTSWVQALKEYRITEIPHLIAMSSEMLGVEDDTHTADWRKVISLLRDHYPESLIAYATDRNSQLLEQDNPTTPGWLSDLDLVGATLWHRGNSINDIKTRIQKTIENVNALSTKTETRPFFSEIGYPSADNAINTPWEIRNDAGTNEGVQAEVFEAVLSSFSDNDTPVFLWRLEPGEFSRSNGYSWIGKKAAGVIENFLKNTSGPPAVESPFYKLDEPVGVAKVNSRYLPVAREKHDGRGYELATLDLDPRVTVLNVKGAGFSVADSRYNRGSLLITVNGSTLAGRIPFSWRNQASHQFEQSVEIPEGSKSVTIALTPSDWGTVLETLEIMSK